MPQQLLSLNWRLEGGSILDDSTCGVDSARVYWAWVFEDNARDDVDLPVGVDAEL